MPKRKASSRSRSRYGSRKRARFVGRRRRSYRRYPPRILRYSETKYVVKAVENINLLHNGGFGANSPGLIANLLETGVATSETGRIGDAVYGLSLTIKMWISNKNDRPNVIYRIMVVKVPTDLATSVALGTTLWTGDSGNRMIDFYNHDKYKIVWQKFIRIENDSSQESGSTLKESSKTVYKRLKINRMIKYSSNGGAVPKYQNDCYTLCIVPYDAFGTLTTDQVGSCAAVVRFYFKDP